MRNKHSFKETIEIRCPYTDCGKTFAKTIYFEFETNEKGDVISQRVIV